MMHLSYFPPAFQALIMGPQSPSHIWCCSIPATSLSAEAFATVSLQKNKGCSPCWPILCAVECVPGVYALSASPELHEGTHLSTMFGLHEGNPWPVGSLVKAHLSQVKFEPSGFSSGHLAGPTSVLSNGLSGCRPCWCPRHVQQ